MRLTLFLAQMHIKLGEVEANLAAGEAWLAGLPAPAAGETRLALFPELWTTGYALADARGLAQSNAARLPRLAELARQHATYLGGSLLLERGGQVYNTFVLHTPEGRLAARYEKVHLFRLMDEPRWLAAGERLEQFAAPWGDTGLAICYDLRFPEMFRRYAVSGARLVLVSAEWPAARAAHWQALLRARAIENQCFVAATNCAGETGGETFGGGSAVISPWGETLVEGTATSCGAGAETLHAKIDLDEVERVRRAIPVLQDRRPDIYG